MRKHFCLLFLPLFYFTALFAQEKTVTGKVSSADGEALIGISVIVKGKTTGVSTDVNGQYSIKAQAGDVIVFSSIGFSTQEKAIGNQNTINIKLGSSTNSLDEVVVVGYGTQKRANLTGAVSTVDIQKNLRSRPLTDVGRGLQGAVPGLTITSATGDIGANPKIRLRGVTGSLNAGPDGAKPLILVDNVEIPSLQSVNPDDIESISVLKDAASTSIYGTRGAFGVILVTTKTGKKNAPNRISYSNNLSWSTPTVTPKLADAADNAMASLLAAQRFSPSLTEFNILPGFSVSEASIEKTRRWKQQYGNGEGLGDEMVMGRDFEILGGKLFYYRQWDPESRYIRNSTPQQNHDLSLSGGSEKISYNMGLGYLNQTGLLKQNSDQFDRYNLTLGVNASVTPWLDARGKIIYSNTKTETPFIFSGTQYGPLYYLYRWPSNYPYGTYKGLPFRSAITEVQQAKMDETKNNLSRISAGGTFKILSGLTFDADYTFTGVNEHLHQTGGGTYAYDFWSFSPDIGLEYKNYQSATYNKVRYYSSWSQLNTGKAFATYSKNIKDHALKFILGGDIEHFQLTDQSSERRNLLDTDLGEIPLATGDQYVDGSNGHWSTLGAFGRINYAYKDKYLLELNGRFDGSSRFPVNDLWGFFPSVSAGYVLSREDFMDWSKPFLSFLKLRGSYGSVGNQALGSATVNSYYFLPLMPTVSSGWVLPTGNAVTVNAPPAFSPALTWESIRTLDFGLDTRFFKDKIGISFDWYRRTTANMITAGVNLPSSFGTAPARRNYGELQADGFELAVDFNHTFSNGFHFTVTGTLSDAIEKITRFPNATKTLPDPISGINSTYYEGMRLGEIWGYETDRLFNANDFDGQVAGKYIYKPGIASQSKLETGSFYFGPGDVKYKDLNGDGIIFNGTNTLDDHGDTHIIGNSTPRYQYGFRLGSDWKGFDLDLYFQGVGKRQLWASGPNVFPGFRSAEAWYANQMNYWTPQNPDAFYPRPTDYGAQVDKWDYLPQTRYLLNMAYLRLKNLTFGYTLPKSITNKIKANRVRIYFSAENLLTFDNLDVPIDPEVDFSQTQLNNDRAGFGRVYPYRKTFSGGLQVTF